MSTIPQRLYVSYLTADELVASLARVEMKLFHSRLTLSRQQRMTLNDVRSDLLEELGRRQLTLLGPVDAS